MQFYRTAVKFKGCISQGKNLSAVQETHIQSLGQEDPLEKGMATHTSILAWRMPWTVEPDGLQSMGSQSQTRLNDRRFHRGQSYRKTGSRIRENGVWILPPPFTCPGAVVLSLDSVRITCRSLLSPHAQALLRNKWNKILEMRWHWRLLNWFWHSAKCEDHCSR